MNLPRIDLEMCILELRKDKKDVIFVEVKE